MTAYLRLELDKAARIKDEYFEYKKKGKAK